MTIDHSSAPFSIDPAHVAGDDGMPTPEIEWAIHDANNDLVAVAAKHDDALLLRHAPETLDLLRAVSTALADGGSPNGLLRHEIGEHLRLVDERR